MPESVSEASRIFGDRVRIERVRLALSQEEIAHLSGINVSNYGKIERGLGNPNLHTLVRIASVLGVDPGRLVRELDGTMVPDRPEVFTAAEFIRERRARSRS